MTDMDKRVKRRTCHAYRIALTTARPDPSGRRLVVELSNNGCADLVRIRESGRRTWLEFDVAELYRKGLIAEARVARKRGRK